MSKRTLVASGHLTRMAVDFRRWTAEDELDAEVSAPQAPDGRRFYRTYSGTQAGDRSPGAWHRLAVTDPAAIMSMGYLPV